MKIGEKIKEIREQKGLSLRAVSLKCKTVSASTIMRIEKGANPTQRSLEEIAQALKVDISDFFDKASTQTCVVESLPTKLQQAIDLLKQVEERNLTTVIGMLEGVIKTQNQLLKQRGETWN